MVREGAKKRVQGVKIKQGEAENQEVAEGGSPNIITSILEGRSKPRSEIKHTGGGQTSWAQMDSGMSNFLFKPSKGSLWDMPGCCEWCSHHHRLLRAFSSACHREMFNIFGLEHVQVSWEKMSANLTHLQLHPVYVHIRCRKSNWCTATRH